MVSVLCGHNLTKKKKVECNIYRAKEISKPQYSCIFIVLYTDKC